MHRAVCVKPMKNHLILVRFDDGKEKIYNCYPLLEMQLFSGLEDRKFFETVHIDEMGLVCWDTATDISPYELYENSEDISDFSFA